MYQKSYTNTNSISAYVLGAAGCFNPVLNATRFLSSFAVGGTDVHISYRTFNETTNTILVESSL